MSIATTRWWRLWPMTCRRVSMPAQPQPDSSDAPTGRPTEAQSPRVTWSGSTIFPSVVDLVGRRLPETCAGGLAGSVGALSKAPAGLAPTTGQARDHPLGKKFLASQALRPGVADRGGASARPTRFGQRLRHQACGRVTPTQFPTGTGVAKLEAPKVIRRPQSIRTSALGFYHHLAAVGDVTAECAFGHAEGAVNWMWLLTNEPQPSAPAQAAHCRAVFLPVLRVR